MRLILMKGSVKKLSRSLDGKVALIKIKETKSSEKRLNELYRSHHVDKTGDASNIHPHQHSFVEKIRMIMTSTFGMNILIFGHITSTRLNSQRLQPKNYPQAVMLLSSSGQADLTCF